MATVAWKAPGRELALKLAGVREFSRVDRGAFGRFADKAGIAQPRVYRLIDATLAELRRAWREAAVGELLPPSHAGALRDHWRRVPLLRAAGALDPAA